MDVRTTWVRPPQSVQGLDHLGTHAPCIDLYSRLLPGITNVTDRARYYSIYPWFVWAFDQRYSGVNAEKFEQLYRRADCLLTLIAERHARCTDQDTSKHGIGMIGRQKLVPALDELAGNKTLKLSTYSTREDNGTRYFKNRLGGLGQYYIGTLRDLGILDVGERGWIRYTKESGQLIAETVAAYVNGDTFFAALEADRVSLDVLDQLNKFCFCQLPHSGAEHAQLTDLLLERDARREAEGQRRLTLGLALSMVEASAEHQSGPVTLDDFETAVYCRSFGRGKPWIIHPTLERTANAWALYVRNDLLSIAAQALFAVGLKMLEQESLRFGNGQEFQTWVAGTAFSRRVAKRFDGKTFGDALSQFRRALAPLDHSKAEEHEWAYSRTVLENFTTSFDDAADELVIVSALSVLFSLAARKSSANAYEASPFAPGFLDPYPINLESFERLASGEWLHLSIPELLGWLTNRWGIETHLSVALRKLRYNPQATFHVRPTERGLEVVPEIPAPTPTNPRMRQGLQMLRDINAIADTSEGSHLTGIGKRLLKQVVNG